MTMTFYYGRATCSLASHIALEESGAEYKPVALNMDEWEHIGPEYLKVNAKGRVPALVTGRGVLTETPAILAFIAQSFPRANLGSLADPFEFAQIQSFVSYLCSTVHVAHAHGRRGVRWADDPAALDAMKRKVPQNMTECFDLMERTMLRGPWVMGDKYTICDPYLFTITRWLPGDTVDIERFPAISAHHARMLDRGAVQKVLARENASI